ncbi:MAG: VCBS repeat-containing protein [Myxococcales bacterium]|nr:VCBS repeat-containing protein [Myxococcales bacterium]
MRLAMRLSVLLTASAVLAAACGDDDVTILDATRDDAATTEDRADSDVAFETFPDETPPDGAEADAGPDPGLDAVPDADADVSDVPDVPDVSDSSDGEVWTMPPRPDTDSPPAGVSWRYGGGCDYPDLVDPAWPIVTVVRTRAELEAALAAAAPGAIVYVADGVEIDLTGTTLHVPAGVWLAGGRGRDCAPGARLYTTETVRAPLLRVEGDDVRITGLRIHGADPDQCPAEWPDACTGDIAGDTNCRDCMPVSNGISVSGHDRLEVDNCELAGWSYAAVYVADGVGHRVHHNDDHHTQRQGLGYGVVLNGGGDPRTPIDADTAVEIAWNRFDYNRHAVAGSGFPRQDYVARHNLVLSHSIGHIFDMHGMDEQMHDGNVWAGRDIRVHDNTVLCDDQYSFVVRGRPATGAWLFSNCLARASAEEAALQRYYFGNFWVDRSPTGSAPNRYGRTAADCETVRWCTARGGAGPWRYLAASSTTLSTLALHDFDGDGVADVFRPNGSAWQWSRSGTSSWATLRAATDALAALGFGDFDGDGRTDVFRATGSEWQWSRSGTEPWARLNTSSYALGQLRFGDFDGDGRTDVFTATGSEWRWSRSGSSGWATLQASTAALASLAFGDFDGDGRTDVFRATGSEWQWSRSGTEPWARLNTSSYTLDRLAFADFDGDGRTDILSAQGNRWMVSWSGSGGWRPIRIASEPLSDLGFADFDGDGADDVFRTGCL